MTLHLSSAAQNARASQPYVVTVGHSGGGAHHPNGMISDVSAQAACCGRPARPLALVVVRHPRFLDPWTSMSLVSKSMLTGLLAFAAHPRTRMWTRRAGNQPC